MRLLFLCTLNTKKQILSKIEVQCLLVDSAFDFSFIEANEFLRKYIHDKDERNFYDSSYLLGSSATSRNTWAQEIYYLMLAAEDYLQIGETVILTQTPFNQIRGFSYTFPALEGFYAIYNAESRVVAEVSYDGKEYTMNMKYYIFDYYDWDRDIEIPVGFVTPKELYKLCKCGAARAYENWGLYEKQIKWIADTQERDDVLKKEKMILCFETNITNIPLW